MGLFGLFGKSPKQKEEEASRKRAETEDLELYSGMRVEVTSNDGRMFQAGRLVSLRGDRAQLEPFTDGSVLVVEGEEPIPVTLRGFSSLNNKAVLIEATIRMGPNQTRYVEHLRLIKTSNDRAFFRMDADTAGVIIPMSHLDGDEEECKLVNISVGGCCVGCRSRRNVGDTFRLQVQLLPQQPPLQARCQILRIIERRHDYFEYGCRFMNLNESEEDRILQAVFELQRKKRQS